MTAHAGYRPEIDGLRAVAVAAVVVYHAGAALLPGGFVGVDVFFVISGYLITAILAQEWQSRGRIDLAGFYARRMLRLMPALVTVLLSTVAAAVVLLPGRGLFQPFLESAVASVLFVANFHFQWNSGGYFDTGVDQQPLLHLWSLAVEEQFYLVYPLVLVALRRYAKGRDVVVLGLLSLASLWLAEHWLQRTPALAFYQMPSRFWELALGGMVALGRGGALGTARASWQAAAGLVLIAASAWWLGGGRAFPGLGALAPVAGAALVLHAVHGTSRLTGPGRWLSWKPVVWLGLISYPLYLWHWPLLALDQATRLGTAGIAWRLLLCLLAVVLAWLTYRFVETPFRRARRSGASSTRVLRRGLMVTAAMLAGLLWMSTLDVGAGGADLVSRTRHDRPADIDRCHFTASASITSLAPAECRSATGLPVRLALWGDSHALAWKPFAQALAAEAGWAAEAHTMDACPPVDGFRGSRAGAPEFGANCAAMNAMVRTAIESGRYEVVVVVARWPVHLGVPLLSEAEKARASPLVTGSPTPGELNAGLRSTLELASRRAGRVIVVGPTPVLPFEAPDCIGTGRLSECTVPKREFLAAARSAQEALLAAASGLPNVEVVDPTDFFCPDQACPPLRDGYGLFWDDDHVSSTAARQFAAEFIAAPERFRLRDPNTPVDRPK